MITPNKGNWIYVITIGMLVFSRITQMQLKIKQNLFSLHSFLSRRPLLSLNNLKTEVYTKQQLKTLEMVKLIEWL